MLYIYTCNISIYIYLHSSIRNATRHFPSLRDQEKTQKAGLKNQRPNIISSSPARANTLL